MGCAEVVAERAGTAPASAEPIGRAEAVRLLRAGVGTLPPGVDPPSARGSALTPQLPAG